MDDLEENCVEEINTLQSIYETTEFKHWKDKEGVSKALFKAFTPLPQDFKIYEKKTDVASAENTAEVEHAVTHLPPIEIALVYPNCYPSQKPPFYTLSCSWLTRQQLSKLCQQLDKMWAERSGIVILYSWFLFLQQDALQFLQVQSPLELSEELPPQNSGTNTTKTDSEDVKSDNDSEDTGEVLTPSEHLDEGVNLDTVDELSSSEVYVCYCSQPDKECPMSKDGLDCRTVQRRRMSVAHLLCTLLQYNKEKEQADFDRSKVACTVCFTDQPGRSCLRVGGCRHAFCKECLEQFFSQQIKNGRVHSLKCLSSDCDSEAYPHQVKAVVSPELFDRYSKLQLQRTLDAMPDIVYCPRRTCQYPVTVYEDSFGHCPFCFFAFCLHCRQAYHPGQPCQMGKKDIQKIHNKYKNGNQATREELERLYGKRSLKHAMEEAGSLEWMEQNTRECPRCHGSVQKTQGCNMITCTCGAHFCWLCGEHLRGIDPYGHFRQQNHPCFDRLEVQWFQDQEFFDYEGMGDLFADDDEEEYEEDAEFYDEEGDYGQEYYYYEQHGGGEGHYGQEYYYYEQHDGEEGGYEQHGGGEGGYEQHGGGEGGYEQHGGGEGGYEQHGGGEGGYEQHGGGEGGYEQHGGEEGHYGQEYYYYEQHGGGEGGYEQHGGEEGGYEQHGGEEGGYEQHGGEEGGYEQHGGEEGDYGQEYYYYEQHDGEEGDYGQEYYYYEQHGGEEGGYEQHGGEEGGYEQHGGEEGGYEQHGGEEGGYEQHGGEEGENEQHGGEEGENEQHGGEEGENEQHGGEEGENEQHGGGEGENEQHGGGEGENEQHGGEEGENEQHGGEEGENEQHGGGEGENEQHGGGEGENEQHGGGEGENKQHGGGEGENKQHGGGEGENKQHGGGEGHYGQQHYYYEQHGGEEGEDEQNGVWW